MNNIVNEYGNVTDAQYLEFEKRIGAEVRAFLQSLLDRGVPPGEVRVASHYLMASLHMAESQVILKYQMGVRKDRPAAASKPMVSKPEKKVKDLGVQLDVKVRQLRERHAYTPDVEGFYVVDERSYLMDPMGFDKFADGRPYSVRHSSARKAYIFKFTDED